MPKTIIPFILFALLLVSCGGSKTVTEGGKPTAQLPKANDNNAAYVSKVLNNAVKSQNLVAKVDVTLNANGQDISVDGKLQMRRDKAIRITLTALGFMEVGRLEFTPEYFMIVDRINKQYVKSKYTDIAFLKDNGVDFYTLQSLFWNELFMPGHRTVTAADCSAFKVGAAHNGVRSVSLTDKRLALEWNTDANSALIKGAKMSYTGGNAAAVTFSYDKFTDFEGKKYPQTVNAAFKSADKKAANIGLNLRLGRLSNDSSWDAETPVSSKYTPANIDALLQKLAK